MCVCVATVPRESICWSLRQVVDMIVYDLLGMQRGIPYGGIFLRASVCYVCVVCTCVRACINRALPQGLNVCDKIIWNLDDFSF